MSKGRHNNDNTDDSYPSTGPWGTPNILEEFGSEGDDKIFLLLLDYVFFKKKNLTVYEMKMKFVKKCFLRPPS